MKRKILLWSDQMGCNDKTEQIAIRSQFDDAPPSVNAIDTRSFSERLAAILTDGKWGLIDNTGKIVMPPQSEDVRPFCIGLAARRITDNN